MIKNILGIIISYVFVFLVIGTAKLIERKGKEASRKYIHIALAFWWIIVMIFFDNMWFAAIPPATFIILNYISIKKDLIKVMEREEENKDGFGTVYYAISLLILVIITFYLKQLELGLVSVFVMAFGDGLAAIIGKKIKSKKYKIGNTVKSFAGSTTMFIVSFIIIAVFLYFYNINLWFIKTFIISIILTIIEAISIKGTDNLTVPLATCLLIHILL